MFKVDTICNFFSKLTYDVCNQTSLDLLNSPRNTFLTNSTWEHNIVKDSFPVLVHKISKESDLFRLLKREIEDKSGYYVKEKHDIMFYYWTRFSYIPWHNDGIHTAAATIYLNEKWDIDWGGIFLHKDDMNEIKGIMPESNKAVLLTGGVWHSTTPVNCSAEVRRTVQVFLARKDEN